jgi:Asp-tRNA(Asn)/Glu-tRNA(Gln) amidotransferase B subunit
VRTVLAQHADAVAQYRAGRAQTFGFLVGQVMKASGGKANPKLVKDVLQRELEAPPRA